MNQRSEGVKRLVTVLSILFVISWVLLVLFSSDGFSRMHRSGDWLTFIAGIPIAFLIPPLVPKAIYWVKDGFNQHKGR